MGDVMPEEAEFDEFAARYDEVLNEGLRFTGEDRDYFAEGRVAWLKHRLLQQGVRASSCFDFGCGTGGACLPLLRSLGLDAYVGYDPSQESIAVARAQLGGPQAAFEYAEEAVAAGSMDLAFTNGVFHHIPPAHRAACVRQVGRALKPGGWFAFWENNRWNPIVHFLMSRVPFDKDAQMLYPHQARRLLVDGGFEIVLTDYLFVFPSLLKALRPMEPALCKLPLGGQYLVLARKL
jgi:SAM-dependent methyltransferase